MKSKGTLLLAFLALALAFAPAQAANQDVYLAQGFNFYALTVTPADTDTIKDAATLMSNVAEIDQTFRFDPASKSFKFRVKIGPNTFVGENFPLVAGEGYIFKASAVKNVTFVGVAAASAQSTLVKGFNLVGFPTVSTVPTAKGLLTTYATQLKSVFAWNYNTQSFQFVIRLDANTLFGADFDILPGTGFFLDVVPDAGVVVNFGAVASPTDVVANLSGEIAGDTIVAAGAPSPAPNRVLSNEFTVEAQKLDGTVLATVQTTPTATGYAYAFTNLPAYVGLKIVAKGPNNEFVSGFIGKLTGNATKNLDKATTALAVMIERDTSKFVSLINSSASSYASEEQRLRTLMGGSLDTIVSNIERMRKLVATQGITLAELRSGILSRVEITDTLARQLASYYADPTKRAVEAMDAYRQAIALIDSQAGRENAEYVRQALTLLNSITGVTDPNQLKQVAVAKAAANRYMGDLIKKGAVKNNAPARSFMGAFKSLLGTDLGTVGADTNGDGTVDNPTTAADYYTNAEDAIDDFVSENPTYASDPTVLATELPVESELAAVDPTKAEEAAQHGEALEAQLSADPTQEIDVPGDDLDYTDVVDYKAQAYQNAGNPAGAVESYNKIDPEKIADPTKKAKAEKVKNYGLGKAKIDMGDVEGAFDYLKNAVADVAAKGGVENADYAKFEKINEALLAMAAVIEKLKAQNSTKLNDSSLTDAFKDPKAMAQKIDKKSEIYVTVVVVVVQQQSTNFGETVLVDQNELDENRKLLNEGMALMSDFHFKFGIADYAGALAKLDEAKAKFDQVVNNISDVDEAADKVKLNLKAQAKLQIGLVSFFKFRISILKKEKNDDHRKAALKAFYEIRDKYKFLAAEIDGRIKELEDAANFVAEIQNSDFDTAVTKVDQGVKLLRVGDKARAFPFLEEAVNKFDLAYKTAGADATLKKEALRRWAEARFYRFFAYTDEDEKELFGKPEAVAALNFLRIKYPDLQAFVMDLQNRLTNAQLFVATTEQTGQSGAQVGQESMPAVFLHALKLKMKAAELYKIGEPVQAKAAFDQAKALFDLLMVDEANKQSLIDILLDTSEKVAAVKAIAGIEIRNNFKPDGPRLSNPLYWMIVAASAQKELALMYADRFFALRAEADRKAAVDLLNRAIARYPDIPFVAELRRIIDDLTGGTTTNASAPMIGNLKVTPQSLSAEQLPATMAATVDVVDPNGKEISKVTLSVLFQNQLLEEIAFTNAPLPGSAPNLLPSAVLRSGTQSPRWTAQLQVPAGRTPGEYILIVKAVNADNIGNELKTSVYLKPAADALAIRDVYIDQATRKLVVKLSKALPADTQSAQHRVRIDVLQPPPAGVANALPVAVSGYVNLPMQRIDDVTRELPIENLFDAKFPFFGQFQIQAKIVEVVGKQVLFTRAIPYFREKPVDQTVDPVVAAFREFLKVMTYTATEQAGRLAELRKIAVHQYAPGALEPGFEAIFDTLFKNVSASSMTVKNGPDPVNPNATRDLLEVEYVRPDYAIVHALVVRSHTFAKNTAQGVFDPEGKLLLPPGLLGKTYAVEEWMDFPFFLVNNRWYAAFGQDESAQNQEGVFLENVFINAQNVMTAFLTRPVDVSKFKVRLGIFKAPDPTRGVMVPSVIKGFEALDLRPVNPVTAGTLAVTTAREFALPMQSVIPATFPVFGPIEFNFRVIDATGAEVATYGMPYYRQLPEFTAGEADTLRARIAAVIAAVKAKNENALKALAAVNGVTGGDLESAVKAWFDALPAQPDFDPDMATLFLERRDVNRAAAWFETALALPTPAFEFVRLADGKWYWDTTPAGYFNATDKPGIADLYFGGNDDLVVRTTVGKTVDVPAVPPATGTVTNNVAVKLAILKMRADGTLAPVGSVTKPSFFYAGSGTNHEWKLPLAQAVPPTFTEYGDLILEAQLFMPAETAAEPIARMQMNYFRPYAAANDAPIRAVAERILAVLNDKTKDDAAKLAALKALCVGGDFGPQDALDLPALIGAFTQQSLTLVPDTNSFGVHFPKPDFAEFFGMVKISGVYRAPLPGGLFSQATGIQMLPPGGKDFAVNDWYMPVHMRFRLVNGQWLKTNDDPWATPAVAGGSYIMEAFVDPQGALVVRTVEDPNVTPAPVFKVRAAILTPPPPGATFFQDIPVGGYENLEAVKGAAIAGQPPLQEYKISPTRLFGPNFPVYGDLVIAVKLVDEAVNPPVQVSDFRIPYFRAYQNDAVTAPLRTFFQDYLAALQTRDLTRIAAFWSDGATLGQIPAHERRMMEEVTAKILGMQFTVEDPTRIFVQPESPDRIRVNAMVKTEFRYKTDEWMGVFNPVTGDMMLPGGAAKDEQGNPITHLFYRAFNMLVVRMKKPDGTFGWYFASEGGLPVAGGAPMIQGMYLDATDNFVVTLNQPVPVPPATGGYKVRLELLQPPAPGSASPMPAPISGFSGTNAPQAAQVDGTTFTISRSLVLTDRLPVFGQLIVQAVLTPADNLGSVISTYDMPWFRPFENLSGDLKTALETAFQNYVDALATADADSMAARNAIQAMSAPGFQWAGGVLAIDDELRVKLNNQNFSDVDIAIEPGSLMVYPISQTEAAVDALLKFTVTPAANPVDDLTKGVWVGGDQAQGIGWQLFPPIVPNTADQVFHVPFHKYFRLNYADNKWYLAEENAGAVTADVPAIFDVHIEQVPRLTNPAEFVDALVVSTGTADSRYALKYDLLKVTNFGGFVNTQFMDVALQSAEPKRYLVRINQIFTNTFPEFGEFEFRFKLVDTQNGNQKVAEWPFRWYRPFEVSDTLKTALVNQFKASVLAFTKAEWLNRPLQQYVGARDSLRALLADPSAVDEAIDLLGSQLPEKPLAAAWYLLQRHLDNFTMTLPDDPNEYFVEMLNANEAVVHCGNIVWAGTYKRAVGFQGLTLPNGNWLLPPGEVGQAYQEWRGGMRRFVRVPDPQNPANSIWKIKAFGFADAPVTTGPENIPAGEIVDVHFEWDPNLNGVGDGGEKLVVGVGNPTDSYTGTPVVTLSQNGVVKTANPIALVASGVAAMPGVKMFEIKKADLLAGLALAEGNVDVKVENGLAGDAYREFFMPFYYSTYVPVMDHPVTRDGKSFGVEFKRMYGFAPDGKVASYLDFGGTYFPGDPAVKNRIVALRQGTEGGYWLWPFVVEKVPGDSGYCDVAELVVVTGDASVDGNRIRKLSDIYEADGVTLKAGFTAVPDAGGVFFAPIVPHGSWLEFWPNNTQFIDGFYGADGNRVIGFLFDTDNDPANGMTPIPYVNGTLVDNATMTYLFMNGGTIVGGNTIFAKDPKTAGYSPVAQKTLVNVNADYLPASITTLQGVLDDTTYTKTSMGMHFFGMPIVEVMDQGGYIPGGMQIMDVDGMALPVPPAAVLPVEVNKAAPQHMVNGAGFGWNMWQASQALFFVPPTGAPVKIVDNTSYGWTDASINFGATEVAGIADNAGGALVIGDLNQDGTFKSPLSNPFPVVFKTATLQRGEIMKINGAAVAGGTLTQVLKPDGLHLEGTGFGAMVQAGMTGKVLVFIPAYNPTATAPPTEWYSLLNNDWTGWADTKLDVQDVFFWLPENVPGALMVLPFDRFSGMPIFNTPLTNPVAVKFVSQVQVNVDLRGIIIPPATTELTDNAGPIDLTTATSIVVTGEGFGDRVNSAAPERTLVYLPFSGGVPVPLAGNNLTVWTSTQIGPFPIPEAAKRGPGAIKMRNVLDGTWVGDRELLVLMPGGVAASVTLTQVNGQPATMGDPGIFVDRAQPLPILGQGFGPRLTDTTPVPTRFLYAVDNPDILNAPMLVKLLDNTMEGWSETALTVPASAWSNGPRNPLTTTEGAGIFVTDNPIVDGGSFNMISNLALISFRQSSESGSIIQVESYTVGDGNSASSPLDMSGHTAPLFIVKADRELPGPPDPVTSPTFALWWKPLNGDAIYISVNINAERWKIDGNGTYRPEACLAPKQEGLGELFFAPVPLPTDPSLHSNHVWVNFGSGSAPSGFMINTVNGMAAMDTSTTPPTPLFTFNTPFDVTQATDSILLTGAFPAPTTAPAAATHRLVAVYPMNGGEVVTIVNTADAANWSASSISFPKSALAPGRWGFLAIRDLAGGGDLSNAVYFNNGYTEPTYTYLFSIVNGTTLSPSYDPNTMAAVVLPEGGVFNLGGTFPDRASATATHKLVFVEMAASPVATSLATNDQSNTGWSSDAIGDVVVPTVLAGKTGYLVIQLISETDPAKSVAKPVKVAFGGGAAPIAWSNPTIAKVNNNTVVTGGLGDSPQNAIQLDFTVVNDLRIDGTGFGGAVAMGQENLGLFFVVNPTTQYEILKHNAAASGWGDLTVMAPKPMNFSGPGYLVFRTHTSAAQPDWAVEVSNKVYVNVPTGGGFQAPVINALGQGGTPTPVPGDGSYMPFVSSSPLTVNGLNFPASTTSPTFAIWFMQDGMQTPYQVLDNSNQASWAPPILTITMNMSMLANKTGTLFIAEAGNHTLGQSNFVKVAFDGATPPPQFGISMINNLDQGGTITTTTCMIQGVFAPRVTSGPATQAIVLQAYPDMNEVARIDNTDANWGETMVTWSLPDSGTLPNGEYEFALMDVSVNPPQFLQPFSMTVNRP